jgi:hypothetical protein
MFSLLLVPLIGDVREGTARRVAADGVIVVILKQNVTSATDSAAIDNTFALRMARHTGMCE